MLNAGLPWTNPLKLQIGSDEHILDTTINRGLMMLLNNDYYLDMKASILSKELSSVIGNEELLKNVLEDHIKNEEIHGKTQLSTTVVENYYTNITVGEGDKYNLDALTKDTIKYLPITYSAAELNKIIKDTPHNLNRFQFDFLVCRS